MSILKKKAKKSSKAKEKKDLNPNLSLNLNPSVDLDKLAKDNETTANLTDYQAYLRNRMKGVKLA